MSSKDVKNAIKALYQTVQELDEYDNDTKIKLKACMDQPYAFVPLFMCITGATQWDIPDCLFKFVRIYNV